MIMPYDTKWQDALDVKRNLSQNNGVALMLQPEEKWFCVATLITWSYDMTYREFDTGGQNDDDMRTNRKRPGS